MVYIILYPLLYDSNKVAKGIAILILSFYTIQTHVHHHHTHALLWYLVIHVLLKTERMRNNRQTSPRHDPLAYTTTDRHIVPPVWRAKLLLKRRGRVLEGLPFEFPRQPVGACGPVGVSGVCEKKSVKATSG